MTDLPLSFNLSSDVFLHRKKEEQPRSLSPSESRHLHAVTARKPSSKGRTRLPSQQQQPKGNHIAAPLKHTMDCSLCPVQQTTHSRKPMDFTRSRVSFCPVQNSDSSRLMQPQSRS
ncbi:hypothetical protein LXL04_039286 [Taraxacum kok-saghyz]